MNQQSDEEIHGMRSQQRSSVLVEFGAQHVAGTWEFCFPNVEALPKKPTSCPPGFVWRLLCIVIID